MMMRACFASGLLLVLMLQQPQESATQETQETTSTQPSTNVSLPATYWVSFATNIRPGMTVAVNVHLVDPAAVSMVSVSLRNSSNENIIFAEVPTVRVTGGGQGQVIELQIPRTLKYPDWTAWFEYTIRVIATGDVSFNQSHTVTFSEKSLSIFVVNDKGIYQPGDTVKIRVLAMNPDLTILNEPIDILIRDPDGNGIKHWKKAVGVANTGVVEKLLPLSTDPPLGDWTIDATVLGQTVTETFSVDKYVLPKFESLVELPKVMLTSEPALEGKAVAKYTYGKPLIGAQVVVTVQFPYYYDRYGNSSRPTLTQTGTLNDKGEFEFLFYKEDLLELAWLNNYNYEGADRQYLSLNYMQVEVIVNVTDVHTGRQMGAVDTVQFRDDKAELTFLPITAISYKPGLKYTAYLSATKSDGTLFEDYQNMIVTFNVTYTVPKPTTTTSTTTTTTTTAPSNDTNTTHSENILIHHWWPYYDPEDTIFLTIINKTLTASGFVVVEVDVPVIARRIQFEATMLGVTRFHSAQKAASPSGNYIQILAQTANPQVGQTATFIVKTTEPVNTLHYQLYSKGEYLLESEATAVDPGRQEFTVSFPVTENMAPNLRMIAFCFRSTGEVVADSLSLKINTSSVNRVNVSYSQQTVKPGDDVQLIVNARPDSAVFVMAVDRSLELLKPRNDITTEKVDQESIQYDFGDYFPHWRYMVLCGWPYPSHSIDAAGVFSSANVALLTDGNLYQKPYEGYRGGPMLFGSAFRADSVAGAPVQDSAAPQTTTDASVQRVRKNFIESWIWSRIIMGSESQQVLTVTAPDTITSFHTTAFSVHPRYGLSVIEKPVELTVFQNIFLTLDLPYSTIRGEDLCLKAYVSNYHNESLSMTLVMAQTEGISNIKLTRSSNDSTVREQRTPMQVSHRIGMVKPNEVGETAFCFTPTLLGHLPIRVNLTTSIPGDGVEMPLLVEPEGVPRVQAIQVILDVRSGRTDEHVIPIAFPNDTVQGSQRIKVDVAGDLLAPVFENIDELLRLPYGCGEQNMLYYAPNVYLAQYMQATNSTTPERAEKVEHYLLTGYQKEIKYQHHDGSYSTFGLSNKTATGSMWLTAFVTKCFVQSIVLGEDVFSMDNAFIRRALIWMYSYQNQNGSFSEPGTVFNKNMQGGSAKGAALTAYVLICLGEADDKFEDLSPKDKQQLQESILLARTYLEQQLPSLEDIYDLCIVNYALHLTKSPLADQAFDKLLSKATSGPLTLHWKRPKPEQPPTYYSWELQTHAIDIEATSYALLTFLFRGDVASSLPIVRWLTLQRGSEGGFISTQDTVTGLQALALVATAIYQPNDYPVTLTVQWTVAGQQETRLLTLDDSTKELLQTVEVPVENNVFPTDIILAASTPATGNNSVMIFAQVMLKYNALDATDFTTYSLQPAVEIINDENFVLRLSAARVDGKSGGMTLIRVGIPTGYSVDESNPLWDIGVAMMAEEEKRDYNVYFNEMDANVINVTLPMTVTNGIPVNTQPTPITILDYYENAGSQQKTVYYSLSSGKSICDSQPNYENCQTVKATN